MNRIDIGGILFRQRRAIIALVVAFAVGGVFAWRAMPKEEDPTFAARYGSIVVSYPGADPETIEDLILVPIEDEVRTVEGVATVNASASPGVAFVLVELSGSITEPDPYWSKVETALERARQDFPAGAMAPETNWDSFDLEGVLFAVTGSGDLTALWAGAERLAERLRGVPGVKRVEITPEVDRRIGLAVDDASLAAVGLTRSEIADRIASGLGVVPGGTVQVGDQEAIVDPRSDIASLAELRSFPIVLPGGSAVPLESLTTPVLESSRPITAIARFDGQSAVLVGVVPQRNMDGIEFGRRLTAAASDLDDEMRDRGLSVRLASYQPGWIESRLEELLGSLLLGVAIVAAVVVLAMGVRLGLTVAVMVPIVTLAGVLVYAAGGGILHQISIAALVMALGLLVDNAIVVSERIQWFLDEGMDRVEAAGRAVRELFIPLAAATGTTLAAYLPLLLARGETSEFTAAIPRVAMLMLSLSFVFAVIATPTIAMMTLRRSSGRGSGTASVHERSSRLPGAIADFTYRRPRLILALTILLVPMIIGLVGRVELTFFPDADRNQMVIDVELPRDRNIHATELVVREIESQLLEDPRVVSVIATVGRTVPRFYYNVLSETNVPYRGQFLVVTRREGDIDSLLASTREWSREALPGVNVVASRLAQGPPVTAPIEVRVSAEDYDQLAHEVDLVKEMLREIPGTLDVRSTLAPAVPSFQLALDEGAVARQGLARAEVAREVLAVTRGLESGSITIGDESVPVVVTSPDGENSSDEAITRTMIRSRLTGGLVPLSSVARLDVTTTPTGIVRRNGERTAAVLAELRPGIGYNSVLAELRRRLPEPEPGITVAIGGAAEESADANSAIAEQSMVGAAVLLAILLLQFASFRRVLIILITVPLAAVGVIPGLVIFRQPFGFTSMLGVIALIGIVVNNAIILVDLMDSRMKEGFTQEEAIRAAVVERFRPILLTAGTTVAGMVPLLFTSSSLWPPFASAIISGLTVSTLLTLVVVPATYRLLINAPRDRRVALAGKAAAVALMVGAAIFVPRTLPAQTLEPQDALELSIPQILDAARSSATVRAAGRDVSAVEYGAAADRRAAFFPTVAVEAEVLRRNEALTSSFDLAFPDPIGSTRIEMEQSPDWEGSAAIVIAQPIIDLEAQLGRTERGRWEVARAEAQREQTERDYLLAALEIALEGARVEAEIESIASSRDALASNVDRLSRLVEEGRATAVGLALVEVELRRLDRQIESLETVRRMYARDLGRALGNDRPVRLDTASIPDEGSIGIALGDGSSLQPDHPSLTALSAGVQELGAGMRELRLSVVPTVSLELRGIQAVNTGLDQDRWIEGALVGRWVPLAAGEREARRLALAESRLALEDDIEDTTRVLNNASRAWYEQTVVALSRIEVEVEAVSVYERRRAEVELLLTAGRATTTDLLEADAELRAARGALADARIDAALSLFRYRSVSGRSIV